MKRSAWEWGIGIAAFLAGTLSAVAGGGGGHTEGNGGDAVVRRDSTGKIISVELLDLYEARRIFHEPLREDLFGPGSNQDEWVPLQVIKKIEALNPTYYRVLRRELIDVEWIERVRTDKLWPSEGVINDIWPGAYPYMREIHADGATLEQLAIYAPDHHLEINSELVDRVEPVDEAALWVHEAVYAVERRYFDARDSSETRRLVAFLFGTDAAALPAPFATRWKQRGFKRKRSRLRRTAWSGS